ncbi:YadA C-terminal domain-containing protein [Moritella dasanensis]|uniref:YadA C-terminal domain-containing protein n=1 Tax=Moritella dasanensis TaxID=428031 RepID=UPI0002F4389C|nr:YadA C-terminal domain-containing protein [Moritella dasanensis]
MKKLLLATIIASTFASTAVMAADMGQPNKPERPTHPDYSVDVKVDAFNLMIEKANLENKVMITKNVNGDYTLIQEGKSPIILDSENESQFKQTLAAVAKDNSKNRQNSRDKFSVKPIEVPVNQKIDMINAHLANYGEGESSIVRDKNGTVNLTFIDPVSGEVRQLNLSDMSEEQLDIVKQATREHVNNNAPIVSPIKQPIVLDPVEEPVIKLPRVITPEEQASYEMTIVNNLTERANNIKENATDEQKFDILKNEAGKQGYEITESEDGNDLVFTKVSEVGIEESIVVSKSDIESKVQEKGSELAEQKETKQKERQEAIIPDDMVEPTLPGDVVGEARDKLIDGLKGLDESGSDANEQLRENYNQQLSRDDAQDAAFNEFKFETQADIADLYNEIDRLDEKMDGVMAGTHAINNARPFLTGEGQTAVGVGAGFAGSSSAIAVGVAHSFSSNWSVSSTVNVTTGSYSEVSGGVGTQFIF